MKVNISKKCRKLKGIAFNVSLQTKPKQCDCVLYMQGMLAYTTLYFPHEQIIKMLLISNKQCEDHVHIKCVYIIAAT